MNRSLPECKERPFLEPQKLAFVLWTAAVSDGVQPPPPRPGSEGSALPQTGLVGPPGCWRAEGHGRTAPTLHSEAHEALRACRERLGARVGHRFLVQPTATPLVLGGATGPHPLQQVSALNLLLSQPRDWACDPVGTDGLRGPPRGPEASRTAEPAGGPMGFLHLE